MYCSSVWTAFQGLKKALKRFSKIGDAIGSAFSSLGKQISSAIWDTMLKWMYETIYNAVADFFTEMGKMGAEMFDLKWVQATVQLFTMFGWALFAAGVVVAVFDVAVEYSKIGTK